MDSTDKKELIPGIGTLLDVADVLSAFEDEIETISADIETKDIDQTRAELTSLYEKVRLTTIKAQKTTEQVFQQIEQIISNAENSSPPEDPTAKELVSRYAHFLSTPLKVRAGTDVLCIGASHKMTDVLLPTGTFVCVEHKDEFILGVILNHIPLTSTYVVCDVAPIGDEITKFVVEASKIYVLPDAAPTKRNRSNTYAPKTKVLALWSDEEGWTSTFYPAVVRTAPTTPVDWYSLLFDGGSKTIHVPEKFIVPMPDQ